MDDRRKQERVPMRVEAEIRFSSWEVFKLIYTINISQGGMNLDLTSEEPPKVGSTLVVKLTLPAGPPIELDAEVRHATEMVSKKAPQPVSPGPRRYQVGVQFTSLDGNKKSLIEATIRAHGGSLDGPIGLRRKDQ